MKKHQNYLLVIALGSLLGVSLSAQGSLSAQVLSLLTRINTWTAKNTFLDLRLAAGSIPSDTALRFYVDNSGNLFFNGGLVAGSGGSVTPHNLLSTTHPDTLAASVARGSVLVGNATPKWAAVTIGAAGRFLRSDGTDAAWGVDGSALTNLAAAQLTGTLPALSGVNLTNLNASNLASGTIPLARLSALTNSQVDAAAAIAYTKLALTGSILAADITTAAGIPYSKLTLTNSLVNGDLVNSTLTFGKWAANGCTNLQVPQFNGTSWGCASVGTGSGTVTSVALALPAIFTVSGSPVTTTGTLTGTLATQTANTLWAGPTTGAAATPAFRALVNADLPLTGVVAGAYSGAITVNTAGVVTAAAAALNLASGVGASVLPMANGGTGVSVSADDTVLVGSGVAWAPQSLANCPNGIAYLTASNTFPCVSGGPTHNLLSATHSDTLAASPPTRGDMIVANATPVWARKALGTIGQLWTNDGVDPSWSNTIARGTVTTSQPWSFTQTWNAGAVTFAGLVENITNTASAAASTLLDLQVGGVSQFAVTRAGAFTSTGNGVVGGTLQVTGNTTLTGTTLLTGAATFTVAPASINGLTTAGNGIPILLATTGLLSAQVANVAVTNLTASAAAGFYRVCSFAAVTTAASSTSTLPAVTIKFNNGVAQTKTLTATNSGNVTTTFEQACMVLQASAATAISYDAGTTSGAYASSGGTAMQYQLRVTLEALY